MADPMMPSPIMPTAFESIISLSIFSAANELQCVTLADSIAMD